jgi:drug/metabolite transporter (DMT)-like permease
MITNSFIIRAFNLNPFDIPKDYRRVVILRALMAFVGTAGLFTCVKYMPVSIGTSIFFSLPVWSTIFSYFLLKEKIGILDIISLISSLIGMLLINNPFADTN